MADASQPTRASNKRRASNKSGVSQRTADHPAPGVGRRAEESVELADAEFFRAIPADRLAQLRGSLFEKRFERGRVLFFEGESAEYLWTIKRGQVRQYKSSSDGHITTLDVLEPGQIFGAVSGLDEPRYPASAEGVTSGLAWCMSRSLFLSLLEERSELAVEVLRVVTGRLHDAQERVRSLSHDSATNRLAQALLRAANQGEARVTRRDLAEVAGTTVETAIRILRGFERDELIKGGVGRIRVLDEAGLSEIANQSRA